MPALCAAVYRHEFRRFYLTIYPGNVAAMINRSVEMPQGGRWASLPQPAHTFLLLTFYAAAIWLALWTGGGEAFRSVWNPAAGLRLALLWFAGPALVPAIAAVEVIVHLATGTLSFASPEWPVLLWGIVSPVLAYGATVAAIRWYARRDRARAMIPPMPFGLAAVAAPCMAALTVLPDALVGLGGAHVASGRDVITSLTAFAVGDMLGVLVVAPPLLWAAEVVLRRRVPFRGIASRHDLPWKAFMEAAILLAAAIFATAIFVRIAVGSQPAPIILAVVWIGLRFGAVAVWLALLAVIVLMLSASVVEFETVERLQHHFDFATVAVAGYLAGSYRDAQRRARADMARRDRLLLQAERLKTLRAMSVAVIHEISQPLSTLAIEARHLHEITAGSGEEIARGAALIDRKATTLSDLVRRLRRFGGGAVDQPARLAVAALIENVIAIAHVEAKSAGAVLTVHPIPSDLVVLAQEVELSQAVINLLRNAIHATSDGRVEIAGAREGDEVRITVANPCVPDAPAGSGMGVGTLVAVAIVEAHGGRLVRAYPAEGRAVASIILPLVGDEHEWG